MSSASDPTQKPSEFENPLEVIPVIKHAKEVKKFLNTRKAILSGERLYNLTQSEIKERDLLGPWASNAAQSIVDSLPGMFVAACIGAVWPLASAAANIDPLQGKISASLAPLKVPFTLLTVVYVVAYACLPAGYVTKRNWKAAQRKYLFFDAAYGLWPQFILALSVALVAVPPEVVRKSILAQIMVLTGAILLSVGLIWQAYFTAWKIRAELLDYDYLADRPEMFGSMIEPSTVKYFVLTGFALPVALIGLSLAFEFTAAGIANLVHRII